MTLSAGLAVREHSVTGRDGCRLHVTDRGPERDTAVVFLHGLSMNSLVWERQVAALAGSHRTVAVDLRGHGRSDAPRDDSYSDPDTWALDLQAVLTHLGLRSAVLVAWSYAGMVVADYLHRFGSDKIASVFLVAPLRKIGTAEAVDLLGERFLGLVPGLLSTQVDDSLTAGKEFLRLCRNDTWPGAEADQSLGAVLSVRPDVRAAMLAREQDNDAVWQGFGKPIAIGYGTADAIIRPASHSQVADLAPGARVQVYEAAGHSPFLEQPDRFNADLRAFVEGSP
ncbi:alpha/beta fold hydrolase [Nocardia sp. R16R-3T]